MYKVELIQALYNATTLIQEVLNHQITMEEFVEKYNNFYFLEALDGHEANETQKKVLSELSDIIELHRQLQYDVINLIFFENEQNQQTYIDSGRIDQKTAFLSLQELGKKHKIQKLITWLSSQKPSR